MEHQFTIFFSWQSDVKPNKYKIREGIEAACQTIHKESGYSFQYDESTRDESGSPDIPSTVLEKIRNCDVFIADITPITMVGDKALPNPNVLTELGYAMRCHGMERIIITTGKGDYKDYQLPFDINHFRHGKFNPEAKTYDLKDEILASISYILNNGKFQYLRFFNDIHLRQNKETGKYLPDVFLEDNKLKEHLRYFVNPYFFYPKFHRETSSLNFDCYTNKVKCNGWKEFEYTLNNFPEDGNSLTFEQLYQTVEDISAYLQLKRNELPKGYVGDYAIRKIEKKIDSATYLSSNICLLTAKAGQGKTNVVCDLVHHVLLPYYIPFAYVNGYEIDANNVGTSLARILYPEQDYSIGDLLEYIERFCIQQQKCFVLIIDGLNENPDPTRLNQNLQNLLDILLQHEYVRVILTCRTEYYDKHYSNLLSIFNRKIIIRDIYNRLHEGQINILIENYCEYFHINALFTTAMKKQFGENLLLLRIFCEAYENQTLNTVLSLQKEQLFNTYYKKMQKSVALQLQQEGYDITESDIRFLITTILRLMIDHDAFVNVKMDEILHTFSSDQRRILQRFIDSNIIIKRDLETGIFGSEVVNFTYDEFRDFLLSHYLIDVVAIESLDRFHELVDKFTEEEHTLREGLTCFLFLYAKESNRDDIKEHIRTLKWYKQAFLNYIWDVPEENVDERDVTDVRRDLPSVLDIAPMLVYNTRWNVTRHKINIQILLDVLRPMNDVELEVYIEEAWPNQRSWNKKDSDRDHLMNQTQLVLQERDVEGENMHKVFEHLLYLAPFCEEARSIYKQYFQRYNSVSQVQHVYNTTKSEKLKLFIRAL